MNHQILAEIEIIRKLNLHRDASNLYLMIPTAQNLAIVKQIERDIVNIKIGAI